MNGVPTRWLLPMVGAVSCLLAACGGDDEPQLASIWADERAYIGAVLSSSPGEPTYAYDIDDRDPFARAGGRAGDVLLTLDGQVIRTSEEMMRIVESHWPGETIEVEVERTEPPPDAYARSRTTSTLTLDVALGQEPLPAATQFWLPGTGLRWEDQQRLGMALAEITPSLAAHYGLHSPEGVVNVVPSPYYLPGYFWSLEDGDVLLALQGERVDDLDALREVVDGLDVDEALEAVIVRDGNEVTVDLPALGPDMTGINHLPSDARQRLKAAEDRGALHPERVSNAGNFYHPDDPAPGEPGMRFGDVTDITAEAVTIALFSSGNAWTVPLTERTQVHPEEHAIDEIRVGDFVAVIKGPESFARWIYLQSVPFPTGP